MTELKHPWSQIDWSPHSPEDACQQAEGKNSENNELKDLLKRSYNRINHLLKKSGSEKTDTLGPGSQFKIEPHAENVLYKLHSNVTTVGGKSNYDGHALLWGVVVESRKNESIPNLVCIQDRLLEGKGSKEKRIILFLNSSIQLGEITHTKFPNQQMLSQINWIETWKFGGSVKRSFLPRIGDAMKSRIPKSIFTH